MFSMFQRRQIDPDVTSGTNVGYQQSNYSFPKSLIGLWGLRPKILQICKHVWPKNRTMWPIVSFILKSCWLIPKDNSATYKYMWPRQHRFTQYTSSFYWLLKKLSCILCQMSKIILLQVIIKLLSYRFTTPK